MIGIYKITNNINGKIYIGQSWNIEKRWYHHKWCCHNKHLLGAFKKYGIENFSFEILLKFEEENELQVFLNFFEDFYIKCYDSTNPEKGYNKKSGGSNGRPIKEVLKRHSVICVETNIVFDFLGEAEKILEITNISNCCLGKREIAGGYHWKYFGGEAPKIENREKIIEEMKDVIKKYKYKNKKIKCIETGNIYSSLKEASDLLGISRGHICACCKHNRRVAGGYHWEYIC